MRLTHRRRDDGDARAHDVRCASAESAAGHERRWLRLTCPSSTSPTTRRRWAASRLDCELSAPRERRLHQLRRVDRRRRRRDPAASRPRGQRDGAGNLARAAARSGASAAARLHRLRVRRQRRRWTPTGLPRPYVESDPTGPRSVYGDDQARGRAPGARRLRASTRSCARPGCTAWRGATSSRRCCAWRASARRCRSSTIRSARPPGRATSRPALLGLLERGVARPRAPRRARARSPGTGSRGRSSARPRWLRGGGRSRASRWPARLRARRGRRWPPSAPRCCRCRPGRTVSRDISRPRRLGASRARVYGRIVHRLTLG